MKTESSPLLSLMKPLLPRGVEFAKSRAVRLMNQILQTVISSIELSSSRDVWLIFVGQISGLRVNRRAFIRQEEGPEKASLQAS